MTIVEVCCHLTFYLGPEGCFCPPPEVAVDAMPSCCGIASSNMDIYRCLVPFLSQNCCEWREEWGRHHAVAVSFSHVNGCGSRAVATDSVL